MDTFGGVDILIADGSIPAGITAELGAVFADQGLGGAVVQVRQSSTVDLLGKPETLDQNVRVNAVRPSEKAAPDRVAEAVIFLASPRRGP